ncbi:hypothetical protein C7477_102233 [Phyllobacterium leguminum]|uniref:Lytic murein transglycosylase n=1 Tax=Phyllobacterium leguminum TaxID=314237 RepID=A0A318TF43_9HYPH|nr:hypothetical protein C7477_102233 [Phyllobacterium leguminum]
MEALYVLTPLCLARHLPLKGGDWLILPSAARPSTYAGDGGIDEGVIFPLEGEMSGRTEGGTFQTIPPEYEMS